MSKEARQKYLRITMDEVSPELWADVVGKIVEDARNPEAPAKVRNKARDWLAKYLIGEPTEIFNLVSDKQGHEIVIREERE